MSNKKLKLTVSKNQLDDLVDALKSYISADIQIQNNKAVKLYSSALLREVKEVTPYKTGTLKASWYTRTIDQNTVEVHNAKEYGVYANYGHRIDKSKGLWLDDAKTKKNWVNGKFFVEKALSNFNNTPDEEIVNAMVDSISKQIERKKKRKKNKK